MEQVAERQGSARLFAAFKKNFSNNQPSRQLDLKHQYQTAAASGRQSQFTQRKEESADLLEYVSAQKYPLGSNQPQVVLTSRIEDSDSKLSIYPENQFALHIPLRKPPPSLTSIHPPSKLLPVIAS